MGVTSSAKPAGAADSPSRDAGGLSAETFVQRFDAAALGRAIRTPQGFLRAPARLTRTGVLEYRRGDGSMRRELRRPDQVFAAASLASLHDAPITDRHPGAMIGPHNARDFAVGHVSQSSTRADGQFLEAELVITDARMISAVEAGTRREISCGYNCRTIEQPGTWQGQHYDAEQVDIVYNHVGLGPASWGRAGSECAVRLDSSDALSVETFVAPEAKERPMAEPGLDNGGSTSDALDVLQAKFDAVSAERDATSAERDVLQGKVDAMAAELADLKHSLGEASRPRKDAADELEQLRQALAEAQDPQRNAKAIHARAALIAQARPHVHEGYRFDDKTEREIYEAVLKRLEPRFDCKGHDDGYLRGRVDQVTAAHHGSDDDLNNARRVTTQQRADSSAVPRRVYVPWEQPLAVSADR